MLRLTLEFVHMCRRGEIVVSNWCFANRKAFRYFFAVDKKKSSPKKNLEKKPKKSRLFGKNWGPQIHFKKEKTFSLPKSPPQARIFMVSGWKMKVFISARVPLYYHFAGAEGAIQGGILPAEHLGRRGCASWRALRRRSDRLHENIAFCHQIRSQNQIQT